MVVPRLQPYNQDLVEELRRKFLEKHPDNPAFDQRDYKRIHKSDYYLYNFLCASKSNIDTAMRKMETALTWRKDFGIHDISWNDFPEELRQIGGMYSQGQDKEGCRILFFKVRTHSKGDAEHTLLAKRFIAFWLEKLQKEDMENPICIMEDMSGAGISNMDLEVIKFLITCLELYFPALCHMLYIFEMPWLLNAIWKIIEKLLSEESRSHIRFIKQKDVPKYFDLDQVPPFMGGTDPYEWMDPGDQFADTKEDSSEEDDEEDEEEDERMQSIIESPSREPRGKEDLAGEERRGSEDGALRSTENLPPGAERESDVPRKVHFAPGTNNENKENIRPNKTKPKKKSHSSKKPKVREVHVGPLITIRPGDQLVFKTPKPKEGKEESKINSRELVAMMTLTNTTDDKVTYKIKTTSPDRYRVRPSSGQINVSASVNINIQLITGDRDSLVRDKFLVMSTELGDHVVKTTSDLSEFWRRVQRATIVEHRVRCICEDPQEGMVTTNDLKKDIAALNQKITKMEQAMATVQRKSSWQLWIFILQVMTFVLLTYIFFMKGDDGVCHKPEMLTNAHVVE